MQEIEDLLKYSKEWENSKRIYGNLEVAVSIAGILAFLALSEYAVCKFLDYAPK